MGYMTNFKGKFVLDKKLTKAHREYLKAFAGTRRMTWRIDMIKDDPDPKRNAVGLPLGEHGEFFVNGNGFAGQAEFERVSDYNSPSKSQPGLWCQWVPDSKGTCIKWDGGEKFYEYVEWLQYIIDNFLIPWGYKITGDVEWQGEDETDKGYIHVKDNKIAVEKVILFM